MHVGWRVQEANYDRIPNLGPDDSPEAAAVSHAIDIVVTAAMGSSRQSTTENGIELLL